jgi:hypothetical protein
MNWMSLRGGIPFGRLDVRTRLGRRPKSWCLIGRITIADGQAKLILITDTVRITRTMVRKDDGVTHVAPEETIRRAD